MTRRRLPPPQPLDGWLPDPAQLRPLALLAVACLGLGIVWGRACGPADPPAPAVRSVETEALRARVAELEAALDGQGAQNQQLVLEIDRLRQELADAEQAAEWTALAQAAVEAAESAAGPPARLGFDEEALVGSGLHWSEAEALHERWTEAEREKQALTAQALAEGWDRTYRHHDALREVDEEIRAELDDADYDRLLYATGRPNRLVVEEVLKGSAAERAGLRPGDRIVRYDGRRLFSSTELHSAVAFGDPGEPARIEVEREGTRLSVVVPREPLGVMSALTRDLPGAR